MLYLIYYVVLLQLFIRYFKNKVFFSKVAAYRLFRNTGPVNTSYVKS